MPHAVIEYADTLADEFKLADVTSQIHETLIASGLFKTDDIKTRAYSTSDFLVGTSARNGTFIHACISILHGRTPEQRTALSQAVMDTIQAAMPRAGVVTVDIREMDKATYLKAVGETS